MTHPTHSDAVATAAEIEAVLAQQRLLADQLGASRMVAHMAAGRPWASAPVPAVVLPPEEMTTVIHTAALGQLWRHTSRIACLVDPTLAEQILTATSDILPTNIFRRLPYANPLVVFSQPTPCTTADGRNARMLGFFVYGLNHADTDDAAFTTTHNDPQQLGIMTILQFDYAGAPHHELNRLAIPMSIDRLTLPDYVVRTAQSHPLDGITAETATHASVQACIEQVLRPALGALLYLCSKEPDLRTANNRIKRRTRRNPRKTEFVYVGWRIGAQLRRLATARSDPFTNSPASPTGRTQPPRQRACHFKTVWTGKGRTEPQSVFVLPYWIHKDQIDATTTPFTLIPTSPHTGRGHRSRRKNHRDTGKR